MIITYEHRPSAALDVLQEIEKPESYNETRYSETRTSLCMGAFDAVCKHFRSKCVQIISMRRDSRDQQCCLHQIVND